MDYIPDRAPFYRNQIIHFGGSFNHMSEYWHRPAPTARWTFVGGARSFKTR